MQQKPNGDPFKRRATRHRGVSFRVRADGSRAYAVYWQGRYVRAGNTEKEALAKQAELRGKAARGERVVVPAKTTLGEVVEQWFAAKTRIRTSTRRDYRASLDLVILPRFGTWKLAAVDAEAIAALIRDLERQGLHAVDSERKPKPLAASTIKNHLKPLQGALSLAVRRGLIAANAFDHLTVDDRPQKAEPREVHIWSDAEITSLLAASEHLAQQNRSRHDYSPVLFLAARTGMRLGEVLGLKWGEFDREEGVLRVERQWTRAGEYAEPKTAAARRRIALSDEVTKFLLAHRLRSRVSGDDDPIFASGSGRPLSHRNVTRRGFEAAARAAGLDGVSFHALRHAAASRLIAAGLTPVTVANVLGHSDPTVTLRVYARLWDARQTDAAVRAAMAGS